MNSAYTVYMKPEDLIALGPVGLAIVKEVLKDKGFPDTVENIKKFRAANKSRLIFPIIDTRRLSMLVADMAKDRYKYGDDAPIKALFAKKRAIESEAKEKLVVPDDLEKEELS